MDFLLATTVDAENTNIGDLALTDGQITLTPDLKTAVAQHIVIRLRTFFGEWFLDTREGVPYFEIVFIKNPNMARITAIFRAVILETPGVSSLSRLVLDTDPVTRALSVTKLEAKLDDGATLTGSDFGPFIAFVENGTT